MEILLFIVKTLIFYITIITIAAYLSLFERKLIGRIQLRRGPSYCGKFGLLQPLADGLKLFFKYGCLENHSVYSIFAVALLLFCSLLQFSFIPIPCITDITTDNINNLLNNLYTYLYDINLNNISSIHYFTNTFNVKLQHILNNFNNIFSINCFTNIFYEDIISSQFISNDFNNTSYINCLTNLQHYLQYNYLNNNMNYLPMEIYKDKVISNSSLLSSNYSLLYLIIINEIISFSEALIGISSKSKFGIIGGIRCIFQKLAYDIPYILLIICISVLNNTLNIQKINKSIISSDFTFLLFLMSIIFFIINLIKLNHIPFDCVEAESELVAGAYTEYGGMLFGMIYLSDYLNVLFSAIIFIIFFIGIKNPIFFILSIISFISSIIIIRTLFPRYLQLKILYLSYKYFIPINCLFVLLVFIFN